MKRVLSPTNFPKPSLIRRKMHLISVDDLTDDFVDSVLKKSDEMRTLVKTHGGDNRLNNKLLTLPFFEASTRTNCSFQAAILRLGGKVVPVNEKSSSSKKGESLEDTIRTLSCYSDIIVIRHPEKGSSLQASLVSNVPVVNAGWFTIFIILMLKHDLHTDSSMHFCNRRWHWRAPHTESARSLHNSIRTGITWWAKP